MRPSREPGQRNLPPRFQGRRAAKGCFTGEFSPDPASRADRVTRGVVAHLEEFPAPPQGRTRIATGLAARDRVAGLFAVTEQAVVANGVAGDVIASVGELVARVVCAADSVVASGRGARLADAGVAGLATVAEQAVVAVGVDQAAVAGVGALVAGLALARITAGLAARDRVAGLVTVTEQAVVADSVAGGVIAPVGKLVAGIGGAADSVVASGRGARLADAGVTGLATVAEQAVVALGVDDAVGGGGPRLPRCGEI